MRFDTRPKPRKWDKPSFERTPVLAAFQTSPSTLTDTRHAQRKELKSQLYCLSEVSEEEPLQGLKESYLLLSSLPNRFIRDKVRAGCVFIDIFDDAHRSLLPSA
jgi:hypothetical protein